MENDAWKFNSSGKLLRNAIPFEARGQRGDFFSATLRWFLKREIIEVIDDCFSLDVAKNGFWRFANSIIAMNFCFVKVWHFVR